MRMLRIALALLAAILLTQCTPPAGTNEDISAADILGNPDYTAMSYGGYRHETREQGPSVADLKEDLAILDALGVKVIRTYNASQFPQAERLLKAIREMKEADPSFKMYVMLGAWIDCEGAWGDSPNHDAEDLANNTAEIGKVVELVNSYPDIVKILAVGNEAMVHWASGYFVRPGVILKWVNYLQDLKKKGQIPSDTWITTSDNFASWGGGSEDYHHPDLEALIEAVDYVSMHTYTFLDTHHNPDFWKEPVPQANLSHQEKVHAAMQRAFEHTISQYESVAAYLRSIGVEKPIHIGETGWATVCSSIVGPDGSGAADEFKQKLYYEFIRDWTREAGMSCFFFEAFDEPWKDEGDPDGVENHFGLFTLEGKAKYALWDLVDESVFEGLTRSGQPITKSFGGDEAALMETVSNPK